MNLKDLEVIRQLAIQYMMDFNPNETLPGLKRPLTDSEINILAFVNSVIIFQNVQGKKLETIEFQPLDFSPEVED